MLPTSETLESKQVGERLTRGDVSPSIAQQMFELVSRLYPTCRSITGNGVRQTLKILREYIPLTIHEVPTGTAVFDWTVPKEWNIADAYIKNPTAFGSRISGKVICM
jgi:aminopeptidase-like protein